VQALIVIRRKNIWSYTFKGISLKVIKKDVPILARGRVITKDLPILASKHITKSGYTSRSEALRAGMLRFKEYYNRGE